MTSSLWWLLVLSLSKDYLHIFKCVAFYFTAVAVSGKV